MNKKAALGIAIGMLLIAVVIIFGRVFLVKTVVEKYDFEPIYHKAGDVTAVSGITFDTGILGLNENKITALIEASFEDNSIDVTDIERVFPNKVILKLRERVPILAVKNQSGKICAADIDFQLNKTISSAEAERLIEVIGISVNSTFNIEVFRELRESLKGITGNGIPDYALNELLESVTVTENSFEYKMRNGAKFIVERGEDVGKRTLEGYKSIN